MGEIKIEKEQSESQHANKHSEGGFLCPVEVRSEIILRYTLTLINVMNNQDFSLWWERLSVTSLSAVFL